MGKHEIIRRINSCSSGAFVEVKGEMDAIFTISMVMCNHRLHRSKPFGLKRHDTETNGKGET